MRETVQYALSGITVGGIYALVALGFTLTYNATGVVNFAQGEFVVLGGLLAVSFRDAGLPLPLVAVLAVLASALIASLVHVATISRLPRAATFNLIMVTVGLAIVMQTSALLIWGSEEHALSPFSGGEAVHVLGGTMPPQAVWVVATVAVVMPILYWFFTRTRPGDAMLAASNSREGASLVGIRTGRVSVGAFMLGAGLAALAGLLITPITTVSYGMGLEFTLKGFTAAVLGGFGSPVGAVIGGIALGLAEKLGAGYISTGYQDFISLAVLVLVLMLVPRGLFGSRVLNQ
jgi:branched-chain amino acid transport system permease protein